MDIQKGLIISRTNLVDSKKEASIPWKGAILVIFFTLAVVAGAYFYNDMVKKKLSALQNNVSSLKQNRDYEKITVVSDSENRLASVDKIMADRINWESLFQKIEENTLPDVTFTNMEAGVAKDENALSRGSSAGTGEQKIQLTLKGTTVGLNNLSKQILAFQGNEGDKIEPLVKDVKINKIDIKKTESGQAEISRALDFTIQGYVNPKIVKNNFDSPGQ
jgi:hypothetical protein